MEKGKLERAINTFRKSLAEIEEIKDKGIKSRLDNLYEDYKIAVESMEMRIKLENYMKDGCERGDKDGAARDTEGND